MVAREVLAPAQLSSAYYYLDQLPAGAASGYTTTRTGQEVENIYAILREGLMPQLFASAPDLTRLWQLLAQGELLPLPVVEEILAPYWDQRLQVYKIEGKAPGAQVAFGGTFRRTHGCCSAQQWEQECSTLLSSWRLGEAGEGSGSRTR